MPETLIKMASEQSFSIALLLFIAYLLWRTMRADMREKETRIMKLETEFKELQKKHNEDMLSIMGANQAKYNEVVRLMQHTTEVLEHNTLVLEKYLPFAKTLAHAHHTHA